MHAEHLSTNVFFLFLFFFLFFFQALNMLPAVGATKYNLNCLFQFISKIFSQQLHNNWFGLEMFMLKLHEMILFFRKYLKFEFFQDLASGDRY